MSEDFAFDRIAEDIRTQDGAMTSHPYFVVFDGNPKVASKHWRFVHAFLTRAAAERYIDGRRYDLRRPFTWVASAHDNYEVRAARAAFAEIARLRAEVERLTRDRDLAERKAAVCREDVEINARRAESAEARVAELEAALRPFADACRPGGFGNTISMHHWQRARALLSPKPATKPAPIPEPKCCATCERIGHVGDDGGPCGCATCPDCRAKDGAK